MSFDSIQFDYSLALVMIGTTLVGAISGIIGSFIYLRRESMFGDSLAHSVLPGIILGFIIAQGKDPVVLILAALVVGLISMSLYLWVVDNTRLFPETVIGIILSFFFGLGIFFFTLVQKFSIPGKQGLFEYIFGNAATLLYQDVLMIAVLFIITVTTTVMFWKPFNMISFDASYMKFVGWSKMVWKNLFMLLMVVVVVVSIQVVGVLLMSCIMIAPAVIARRFTHQMKSMVIASALIGGGTCFLGSLISSSTQRLPTGPTIVVLLSILVVGSLLVSSLKSKGIRQSDRLDNRTIIQPQKKGGE